MIRGPHQLRGYLDPDHNADAFTNAWVRTVDQAELTDGRIRTTGRLTDIEVLNGMKISLAEIDLAAAGLPKWELPEQIVVWDAQLPRPLHRRSGERARNRPSVRGHHQACRIA